MNGHLEPELFDAYLDGELPARRRRAVQQHLAQCPRCRQELEQLELQAAVMREVFEQRAAGEDLSDLHQQVMEKIRAQQPLPWRERWRLWWENFLAERRLALAFSAAAVVLLVLAGLWLVPRPATVGPPAPAPVVLQAEAAPSVLIDNLEYTGQRSMIYTVSRNNTTVIWLMDFDSAAKDRPKGEDL